MFKKIMLTICLMFSFILFGSSFDSMAAGDVFYLDYAEPATSEAQGYLVVAMQNNSTGKIDIMTFFWNTYAQTNSGYSSPAEMLITITDSNKLTFNVTQYGADGAWYSLNAITEVGNFRSYAQNHQESYTYNLGAWNYTIVGWKLGGNGFVTGFQSNYDFAVFFSEDGNAILLQEVLDTLTSSKTITSEILVTVSSIFNSIDSVEGKLDSIISWLYNINDIQLTDIRSKLEDIKSHLGALRAQQEASNTWLEKILKFMQEKDEKDKQAAAQQGNQSSSSVKDSIQDNSEGFSDALGGLTSSMSYSGTECSWTFPTMKLPAIPGVMDEVTLVESQKIDFTVWINSIPSGILLLIQSVCTAALIVFCFKELYGTVEYALTLRKGGGAE